MGNPDNQCRAATIDDLMSVISSLNEHGVDYLLIGGYSLFAHGYHRATEDIDVLVPSTIKSGEMVKKALMILPDKSAELIEPEWFTEGENIRVADDFVVDIIMNACGQTYETLKKFEQIVQLNGVDVKTISLQGLLETKRSMRDKDVMDRIILERAINALSGGF